MIPMAAIVQEPQSEVINLEGVGVSDGLPPEGGQPILTVTTLVREISGLGCEGLIVISVPPHSLALRLHGYW